MPRRRGARSWRSASPSSRGAEQRRGHDRSEHPRAGRRGHRVAVRRGLSAGGAKLACRQSARELPQRQHGFCAAVARAVDCLGSARCIGQASQASPGRPLTAATAAPCANTSIANQEIGALPMPESVNSIGKELAGPIILAIGTEAQKLRFLPRILDMSNIWCQGFSEPEAGSDLAGLRTRAVRDGDVWRINGQKIWTSGAYRAQRCLLLARTGPVEDRHRGLALFAVPLDAAGVRVRTIKSIDGKESFCEVFFDNVEVVAGRCVGSARRGLGRSDPRTGDRARDQPHVPRLALRERTSPPDRCVQDRSGRSPACCRSVTMRRSLRRPLSTSTC